ncbi:MAG: Smr/MutS family protein [Bacteroidia bacterium]|nr:Smr/MutS family protein [Bacteroidia bacterium]
MPYPQSIELKLEFNQIKELVAKKCISTLGQQYIDKIKFNNRHDIIEKMLWQVKDFKNLLETDLPFPNEHFHDVFPYFRKAKIEGMWLLEEELHKLKLTIQSFLQIAKYFRDRPEKYQYLHALLEGLLYNDLIVRRIERILDNEGVMKPNASPELAKISAKITDKEKEVRRRIQSIYDKGAKNNHIAEDLEITIRDGRLVLPVLAEFKRSIPGFVHDESNTGQTVYIEPTECFEMNNVIRELQIAYRRERERILLEITDQIRPEIPELEKNIQRMGLFDFIRAKALFAIDLDADLPALSKQPNMVLRNAFHPLLKLNHQKSKLSIVPLNIELNLENRIAVISGPNAGGKSVCLKTVGLLQFMFQTGFLVPASPDSEMCVFKDIMVDIGDEQSIENDLSTYSSHLLRMKYFTDFADGKTLFLIDEFGMGTDPQFGGPLAEAILNHINRKNSFGVVTTHFSNLKNFANNTKGLINASMLFDNEKLQPLYQLEMGKPGSSYAFEIATKTGLAQSIINYAKDRVGVKQKRVDDLLIEVEKEQKQVVDLRQRFAEKEAKANALLEKYTALKEELEVNKKLLIKQAKQEALAIVSEANSKIEATIREIKQNQADTETQRKVRTEIKETIQELKDFAKQEKIIEEKHTPKPIKGDINIGSSVMVIGQQSIGEVLEINKNKAVVAFGNLHTTVDLKKLQIVAKSAEKELKKMSEGVNLNDKMKDFSPELNIIGTRGDEAMRRLDLFIDDAYLLGVKQVRIVHGKGYGILRTLVRDSLNRNPLVSSIQNEQIGFGGDGASIVMMKM